MLKLGLIIIFTLFSTPVFAQKTTAQVTGEFRTVPQNVIDMAICLKAGLRCVENNTDGCYIEGQPCSEEEILRQQKEEENNGNIQ